MDTNGEMLQFTVVNRSLLSASFYFALQKRQVAELNCSGVFVRLADHSHFGSIVSRDASKRSKISRWEIIMGNA